MIGTNFRTILPNGNGIRRWIADPRAQFEQAGRADTPPILAMPEDHLTGLFTPFTLAGKTLRNRIAHAAMATLSTPRGPARDDAGGAAF